MKHFLPGSCKNLILLVLLSFCIHSVSSSAVTPPKKFAQKGTFEIGGDLSFLSSENVVENQSGTVTTQFTLSPYFGYFISDRLEIGVKPLNYTMYDNPGLTVDTYTFLASLAYNFNNSGVIYPFLEGIIGYNTFKIESSSGSGDLSGPCFGGRAGMKVPAGANGLMNVSLQYMEVTQNPSGATQRSGFNDLSLLVGFTLWF